MLFRSVMPTQHTLETLCRKVSCTVVANIDPPADWRDCTGYKVRLRYKRRTMTFPFYQGYGHTKDPEASGVLECLLSDASSVECFRGFEDWCSDLGYDTDSRKAEKTYKACKSIAKRLRSFLGDDFDVFACSDR